MRLKKIIVSLVVLAVVGTTIFFGIKIWRNGVIERQERRAVAQGGDDFRRRKFFAKDDELAAGVGQLDAQTIPAARSEFTVGN